MIIDPPSDVLSPFACLDAVQFSAPDGRILAGIADGQRMRVVRVAPPPGTLAGQHDPVKVDVEPVAQSAAPLYRPCDWVSATEASTYLGTGPVAATPGGDEKGSTDITCAYRANAETADLPGRGTSVLSELRLTAAHVVDAASEFAYETAGGVSIAGIGLAAACTTAPTASGQDLIHRLHVRLPDERLYVATGWGVDSCGVLEDFARAAIPRIGA